MSTQTIVLWTLMLAFCLMGLILAACGGAALINLDKQIVQEIINCPLPPPQCPPDTLLYMLVSENGESKTYAMDVKTIRNPDGTLITHTRTIMPVQPDNLTIQEDVFDSKWVRALLFDSGCPPPRCPPDTIAATMQFSMVVNGQNRIFTTEGRTIWNPNNISLTRILKTTSTLR